MTEETKLIDQCKLGQRKAQKALYEKYRSYWFVICLRYVKKEADALDVLQNSLIKIFTKLDQFNSDFGNFKGWTSKIVTNESIMFLRKNKKFTFEDELSNDIQLYDEKSDPISDLTTKELLEVIQDLPNGYRIVFNMYAIEGYSHKEISETLGISIGTSKSQLFKAKKMLKKNFKVDLQSAI